MAKQVIVDHVVTGVGQFVPCPVPAMPGLSPAVPKDHRRRTARAQLVRCDMKPAGNRYTDSRHAQ